MSDNNKTNSSSLSEVLKVTKHPFIYDEHGLPLVSNDIEMAALISSVLTHQEVVVLQIVLQKAIMEGLGLRTAVMYDVTVVDYDKFTQCTSKNDATLELQKGVNALFDNMIHYRESSIEDGAEVRSRLISSYQELDDTGCTAVRLTDTITDIFNNNASIKDMFSSILLAEQTLMTLDCSKKLYELLINDYSLINTKRTGINISRFYRLVGLKKDDDPDIPIKDDYKAMFKGAVKEINLHTNFKLEYSYSFDGYIDIINNV